MSSDLRTRAQAAAGGEVEPARPSAMQAFSADLQKMQGAFQLAMPRGAEAVQLVRDALTIARQNPAILNCDPKSILGGLMTCAQLGLRPGVLGQAWLIPMRGQATLVVGYLGFAALAHRTQLIAGIVGRKIHENDEWDVEYGLDERLMHRPCLKGDPGAPLAYYGVVRDKHGGRYWDFMTKDQAEDHRERYAMARKKGTSGQGKYGKGIVIGPWVDNFDEMAVKTTVLHALKLAPRDTTIQQAVQVDGTVRLDLRHDADPAEVSQQVVEAEEDEPADEPQREQVTVTAVEGITPAQQRKVHAQFGDLGLGGRANDERTRRLRVASTLVGREVLTSSDLTFREAETLIYELGKLISKPDVERRAALDFMLAEQGEPPLPGEGDSELPLNSGEMP